MKRRKYLINGLGLFFFSLILFQANAQIIQGNDNNYDPQIIDSSYTENFPSISAYGWDTLYLRTSRHPNFVLKDTEQICLRTPAFPRFVMPIMGNVISEFGWRGRRVHTGIDIKLNRGDSVHSAFAGVVRVSRYFSGYGNIVVVRHYNGIETVYAHLSKRLVRVNDTVKCGEVLGLGGRTGRATCDHLHFETRYNEQPFNPRLLIDFDAKKLNSDTLLLTQNCFKFNKNKKSKTTRVNSHSNQVAQSAEPAKKSNSQENKLIASAKVHIIQKGDTLFSLAKKYGTTIDAICEYNGIERNDILHLGQKIKIP